MTVEGMQARRIVFTGSGAQIRTYRLRALRAGEILVRARCSQVSIGTETTLLVKSRWDAELGPGGPPPDTDTWDFEDYGKGESWDMERNRLFPGYSLAGDVLAVGEGVSGFAAGDRVVCLHHHADLAIVPDAPYITLPIPEGVGYEEATFAVLGSVALHAVHRAHLRLGENAVVMGCGLVGLLTQQLARLSGVRPLIAVDLSPARLDLAVRMGADFAIRAGAGDLEAAVRGCLGGEGTGCVFEAVGNPAVLQSCMQVCAPGARVVVMGAIVGKTTLDMYGQFVFRELTLIASQQPRNPVTDSIYYHHTGQRNRRTLLELIRRGSINVRGLVTHRFSWREAPEVYRLLGEAKTADYDGRGDVHRDLIGVMFDWSGG